MTTFHRPSWIWLSRDWVEPSRLVALNTSGGVPKMSVGTSPMVSMALMKLSVVRLGPAFSAALMKMSIVL